MKMLPIPELEQINSMLTLSFYELVSEYVENPSLFELKQYITINRKIMIKFLSENPNKANGFWEEHKKTHGLIIHDIFKIIQDENHFIIVWMDHGSPDPYKHFETIEEAVAEYLFIIYGIF